MSDIGSIIIIVLVFRLVLIVFRALWGGYSQNDYRRDR